MRPRLAPHRLALLGAAVTIVVACSDAKLYVYTAQKWNATDRCLESYTPIETVEGEGADAFCPATCLSVGGDLFVSTVCPPLPDNATRVPASDPECRDALAAEAQKRSCEATEAPPDAREEAEAASDAGEDTGVETDADADAPAEADADAQDG